MANSCCAAAPEAQLPRCRARLQCPPAEPPARAPAAPSSPARRLAAVPAAAAASGHEPVAAAAVAAAWRGRLLEPRPPEAPPRPSASKRARTCHRERQLCLRLLNPLCQQRRQALVGEMGPGAPTAGAWAYRVPRTQGAGQALMYRRRLCIDRGCGARISRCRQAPWCRRCATLPQRAATETHIFASLRANGAWHQAAGMVPCTPVPDRSLRVSEEEDGGRAANEPQACHAVQLCHRQRGAPAHRSISSLQGSCSGRVPLRRGLELRSRRGMSMGEAAQAAGSAGPSSRLLLR